MPYKLFELLSPADAKAKGYRSLTRPYRLAARDVNTRNLEHLYWNRVCEDLRLCNCVVVEYPTGIEIWRHESELDIDPATGMKIDSYIPKYKNERA